VIALTKKIPVDVRSPASIASDAAEPPGAASEAAGLHELIGREYPAVWRFLRRLGVSAGEVDDTAQRVFARVLAQGERIKPGSERAYLMRAAFRAALEQQRDDKRWRSRASAVDIDDTSSPLPGPDRSLALREDLALLDRALLRLAPELRAVLTLFELEGLTFTEISLALSLPRGTVASRVRRAREEFTQAVQRLGRGGTP
jgi:RNA polymerase sigma-70 factor (ECF subfamily)